jgi:hypothetical protein
MISARCNETFERQRIAIPKQVRNSPFAALKVARGQPATCNLQLSTFNLQLTAAKLV